MSWSKEPTLDEGRSRCWSESNHVQVVMGAMKVAGEVQESRRVSLNNKSIGGSISARKLRGTQCCSDRTAEGSFADKGV